LYDEGYDRHTAEADKAEADAIKKAKESDASLDETRLQIETGKAKKTAMDLHPGRDLFREHVRLEAVRHALPNQYGVGGVGLPPVDLAVPVMGPRIGEPPWPQVPDFAARVGNVAQALNDDLRRIQEVRVQNTADNLRRLLPELPPWPPLPAYPGPQQALAATRQLQARRAANAQRLQDATMFIQQEHRLYLEQQRAAMLQQQQLVAQQQRERLQQQPQMLQRQRAMPGQYPVNLGQPYGAAAGPQANTLVDMTNAANNAAGQYNNHW
jgi:hypothetical protein